MTTITEYLRRPACQYRDFSGNSLDSVRRGIAGFWPTLTDSAPIPEHDAIVFYMMNHAFSVVRSKFHPNVSLPDEVNKVCALYLTTTNAALMRMFAYLLVICTRESRHIKSGIGIAQEKNAKAAAFTKQIRGKSSSGATDAFKNGKLPDISIGEYAEYLEYIFDNCGWASAYGGTAWGEIARALNKYVHGEISGEMLLDTAFTLAHNTGPIFNKGMLFKSYTPELLPLLDVQRAGQIPNLVFDYINGRKYFSFDIPAYVWSLFTEARDALAPYTDDFAKSVDFQVVKDSGAISSSIDSYISKQTKLDPTGISKPAAKHMLTPYTSVNIKERA